MRRRLSSALLIMQQLHVQGLEAAEGNGPHGEGSLGRGDATGPSEGVGTSGGGDGGDNEASTDKRRADASPEEEVSSAGLQSRPEWAEQLCRKLLSMQGKCCALADP